MGAAGPRGADRGHQTGVGVGGDQSYPGDLAGGQRALEGEPARSVFGGAEVDVEDLPVAPRVDSDRDQGVHVDHPPGFTDLEHQRVGSDERVGAGFV